VFQLNSAKSNKLQESCMPNWQQDLHEFNAKVRLLCDNLFKKNDCVLWLYTVQ